MSEQRLRGSSSTTSRRSIASRASRPWASAAASTRSPRRRTRAPTASSSARARCGASSTNGSRATPSSTACSTSCAQREIDLGYRPVPLAKRVVKRVKDGLRGRTSIRHVPLKARFEFSALPAEGATSCPTPMRRPRSRPWSCRSLRDGEWDPAFGGGTDVNQPKDQPLALQPRQPPGRFRRHGGARHLRVHAQPSRGVRQDLQLLAFGAADDRSTIPRRCAGRSTVTIERQA